VGSDPTSLIVLKLTCINNVEQSNRGDSSAESSGGGNGGSGSFETNAGIKQEATLSNTGCGDTCFNSVSVTNGGDSRAVSIDGSDINAFIEQNASLRNIIDD
jgi:hypothetical protein